jgi:hypothetical protein
MRRPRCDDSVVGDRPLKAKSAGRREDGFMKKISVRKAGAIKLTSAAIDVTYCPSCC